MLGRPEVDASEAPAGALMESPAKVTILTAFSAHASAALSGRGLADTQRSGDGAGNSSLQQYSGYRVLSDEENAANWRRDFNLESNATWPHSAASTSNYISRSEGPYETYPRCTDQHKPLRRLCMDRA